jgi:formiminotetrahydrofolate cyclodeaminase
MNELQQQIDKGNFNFVFHSNAPMCETANVVKQTEKAVQINLDGIEKTIWLPKAALEFKNFAVTVKPWFKKVLQKPENRFQCIALGVLV